MSLFRRAKKVDETPEEVDEEMLARREAEAAEDAAESAAADRAFRAERRRAKDGPFDASEVDNLDELINLGSILIAPHGGMRLDMQMGEDEQQVISVTCVLGTSQVQMQAFAAPRKAGIWDGIRSDLAEEIARQGGTAEEREGAFGEEILARMPIRMPDGRTGHQATRFIGIDGPRWFVRGVIAGDAVTDNEAAEALESVVRQVVIRRGPEALPPRELLPLQLPAGATRYEESEAEPEAPTLTAPERGPEIAEIR